MVGRSAACGLALGFLCRAAQPGLAQSHAPADSALRDSVLQCGVRLAQAAGFRLIPNRRPDRLGLMRSFNSPGPRQPLDGMRLALAPEDSAGQVQLDVSVTTFMVSRSGLSSDAVPPRPSLLAFADSLRLRCRGHRAQSPPS